MCSRPPPANFRVFSSLGVISRPGTHVDPQHTCSVHCSPMPEPTGVQPMDTSQIRPHMKVVGSDGRQIGKVDRVDGEQIKLTKSVSPDGHHHTINVADVADIKDDEIRLSKDRA